MEKNKENKLGTKKNQVSNVIFKIKENPYVMS